MFLWLPFARPKDSEVRGSKRRNCEEDVEKNKVQFARRYEAKYIDV